MSQGAKLEIVNPQGWSKEYPLQKGILHLGSDPANDIVLDSGDIAPFHLQFVAAGKDKSGYRLVNLTETELQAGPDAQTALAPSAALTLSDGFSLKLGTFTLIFHGGSQPAQSAASGTSRCIGLDLLLPSTRLMPNQTLEGVVLVGNLGQRSGVRFDLKLEGLEPDCYDLAPGPLLSAGGEKEVLVRLHHRGHKPQAGDWRIVIQAAAPTAYPGEIATVTQVLQVAPFFQHRLRLLPAVGIVFPSNPAGTPAVVNAAFAPAEPAAPIEAPAPSTWEADREWDLPAAGSRPATPALKLEAKATAQPVAPSPNGNDWPEMG